MVADKEQKLGIGMTFKDLRVMSYFDWLDPTSQGLDSFKIVPRSREQAYKTGAWRIYRVLTLTVTAFQYIKMWASLEWVVNREVRTSCTGVISEQGQALIQYECCHLWKWCWENMALWTHRKEAIWKHWPWLECCNGKPWNPWINSHLPRLKRGKRRLYHSSRWEHALDHLDFRLAAFRSVKWIHLCHFKLASTLW